MNVYTCDDHDLYYQVGGGSVIVAKDEKEAQSMLDTILLSKGLKPYAAKPYTLTILLTYKSGVRVISDGNY